MKISRLISCFVGASILGGSIYASASVDFLTLHSQKITTTSVAAVTAGVFLQSNTELADSGCLYSFPAIYVSGNPTAEASSVTYYNTAYALILEQTLLAASTGKLVDIGIARINGVVNKCFVTTIKQSYPS